MRKVISVLTVILLVISCHKQQEADLTTGEDILQMDMDENDYILEELYAANDCSIDLTQILPSCAQITYSSVEYPKTITIDFGTGCIDSKGRTKKGKIYIDVSGDMRVVGSEKTITFDNFFINEVKMEGSKHAKNIGLNASQNYVVEIDGEIEATKNNLTRKRVFHRQREWITGIETCETDDDEFLITGSGTITTRTGRTINHSITEAIHLKPSTCGYPLSGKIDFGSTLRGAILDFGTENCDNLATLTLKRRNKTFLIDLDTRTIIH